MTNTNFQALIKQVRKHKKDDYAVKQALINAEATLQGSIYPRSATHSALLTHIRNFHLALKEKGYATYGELAQLDVATQELYHESYKTNLHTINRIFKGDNVFTETNNPAIAKLQKNYLTHLDTLADLATRLQAVREGLKARRDENATLTETIRKSSEPNNSPQLIAHAMKIEANNTTIASFEDTLTTLNKMFTKLHAEANSMSGRIEQLTLTEKVAEAIKQNQQILEGYNSLTTSGDTINIEKEIATNLAKVNMKLEADDSIEILDNLALEQKIANIKKGK